MASINTKDDMRANINLYNGDCMEAMAKMKDNDFDLAIVDPPYGIGYSKRKRRDKKHKPKYTAKKWDDTPPNKEYFKEVQRVSKNQIIWGGNYFELPQSRCYCIWVKQPEGIDQGSVEYAWASFDKSPKHFTYHIGNESGFAPKLQSWQKVFANIHPTQKPVALYKWLLKNYANEGDKILDTHLGSGSIAIACHDMGFDLEAYELDSDYYRDCMKRFKNHTTQGLLF